MSSEPVEGLAGNRPVLVCDASDPDVVSVVRVSEASGAFEDLDAERIGFIYGAWGIAVVEVCAVVEEDCLVCLVAGVCGSTRSSRDSGPAHDEGVGKERAEKSERGRR